MKMGRLFPEDDKILIVPHESIRSNACAQLLARARLDLILISSLF
jgi:hypothetical protein